MRLEAYVLRFEHGGSAPMCACGCDQPVQWSTPKCDFNRYVNGHNEAGFKVTQPTFSREQVERRNAAIRRSYSERGTEIKAKISASVSAGMAMSDFDFSQHHRSLWEDQEYKQQMRKKFVESWSGDAGEERKRMVFTPQFRRRIAESNMKRDIKQKSAAETRFLAEITRRLAPLEVIEDYWINFEEGPKCFDGYVSSAGLLIEFDGIYWHGLDRTSDFTQDQVATMANDMRKNRLVADIGLELIRIKDGTDISDVTELDDLRALAYHRQVGNTVLVDGSPRISDDTPVISRESLILLNERVDGEGRPTGREFCEKKVLPAVKDLLREHVAAHGWFYPTSDEKLDDVVAALRRRVVDPTSRSVSSTTSLGSDFLRARFHSYWDAIGGPVESFENDDVLDRVVRYRLGLNDSRMYDYVLSDGRSVSCHETFDVSPATIRRGFVVQRAAVSWFKPTAAFELYRRFLGRCERPTVWDPSCGFGARLLGFVAACPDGRYVGTEPANQTFSELCSFADELTRSELFSGTIDLRQETSEDVRFDEKERFDLVFTSPPYFLKEKYFDEPNQCWRRYGSMDDWREGFIVPTMRTAVAHLAPGGHVVMNVDNACRESFLLSAFSVGLQLVDELQLGAGRDHFAKRAGVGGTVTEPILVFKH